MDLVQPRDRRRASGVQTRAGARGLQREAHHHIGGGERVAGPDVCKPADLASPAVDVISVPEALAGQLPIDAPSVTYQPPTPAGLVAVANLDADPEPLVPLYLRRPDAVPPKQAPKSPALP